MPDLDVNLYLGIALLGTLAGLLIGSVGIGGVIVVPALVYLFGIPVHEALAAAMLAFLVSGAAGTVAYAARRSIRWSSSGWLWLGAAPAAFIGGLATGKIPAQLIEAAVGFLAVAAGTHSIRTLPLGRLQPVSSGPPRSALVMSGTATGLLSAITGTGGPLVLVPILIALELPALTAIGLAQAIQLPVAALATTGYAAAGTIQLTLGAALGLGIGLGTLVGARLAHRTAHRPLRAALAAILIVIGVAMLMQLVLGLPST